MRARRLGGRKFLRQGTIAPYATDVVCRERGLIVEIDGSGHAGRRSDITRDQYLLGKGFSVLRFWNPEVSASIDDVCKSIVAALEGRLEAFERYLKGPA